MQHPNAHASQQFALVNAPVCVCVCVCVYARACVCLRLDLRVRLCLCSWSRLRLCLCFVSVFALEFALACVSAFRVTVIVLPHEGSDHAFMVFDHGRPFGVVHLGLARPVQH
jgi:hypothetical protein